LADLGSIWCVGGFVWFVQCLVLEKVKRIIGGSSPMQDNNDYQQTWNECISRIYDPQPVNTDLNYRLMQFAKMKPEELKDLNEIIDTYSSEEYFEDNEQAVAELALMHKELGAIVEGLEAAIEGAKQQQFIWHTESLGL
tara:strand:+ start:523 stop:939 length:417 start_codon:yes stop_codon:yes gene_type:complete